MTWETQTVVTVLQGIKAGVVVLETVKNHQGLKKFGDRLHKNVSQNITDHWILT